VTIRAKRHARNGSGSSLPEPLPLPRGRFRLAPLALAVGIAIVVLLTACSGSGKERLVSIGSGLSGPSGLEATVYARGLQTMSAFAFDRRGRVWVATSAATDHGSDGIYVVPRAGERPVKVVAHVNGPLGLTWYRNALYVASIGRVEAFSGFDGTRFAERRTILEGPAKGASNNGILATPDGRLMLSVSTTCDHCTPKSKWAATIVTVRRDGSDLRLYASGVRAGYGLAYYPGTSDLFVSMNQRDDLGEQTPGDWLAVVKQGENWGFPACYGQGGAACTGVPEPTAVLDKHAAAGGVAIVTGQLGKTIGTSAIVAEWQAGIVQRVALTRSGSTYEGSVSTLLTGLKNPLPVATAPDGALLVGDWTTGIVYRIAAS
jgi:glucose/arabinose dehydrogenase